jgi:hypothetical protein
VSMKRNVTAWERKQESWMNHIYQEEWSSKTIWEGKHKIRSNQMKAIAMERQSVCFISKVGRFSQSRTSTCGFDMKCDRFWLIPTKTEKLQSKIMRYARKRLPRSRKLQRKALAADTVSREWWPNQKSRQRPRWYYIHWLKSLSGLPRAHSVSHTGNVSRAQTCL